MKAIFAAGVLLAMVAGTVCAHDNTSPVLATSHVTCHNGATSTQDIKLHDDGSVQAQLGGRAGASALTVKVDGDIVTLVQTLPYGTITRRLDMAAYARYMKTHPDVAATEKTSYQNLVASLKANCRSATHFRTATTGSASR